MQNLDLRNFQLFTHNTIVNNVEKLIEQRSVHVNYNNK